MTDHTGPNTGPGGCHGGLLSRRYQRLLSTGVVAAAPIPAVPPTAPTMSAASRRVRPDGRDSAADTVVMFLTLPPALSDPEPTQPTRRRIRSGAGENPWLAVAAFRAPRCHRRTDGWYPTSMGIHSACCVMATSVSGWSTTASRVDAVREHQAAGTGCAETMRPVLDSLTKPALDALLASLAHVLR